MRGEAAGGTLDAEANLLALPMRQRGMRGEAADGTFDAEANPRLDPMTDVEAAEALVLREMLTDDIPACLSLCRAAGWNQTERDWRQFLDRTPGGVLVAVRGARVIGSVATIRYRAIDGGRLAWVAMVLVDPSERGRGVGRELLTHGLALLDDVETARLDATPAGEKLYLTLGFREDMRLSRLQRAPAASPLPSIVAAPASALAVRPLAAGDLEHVAAYDARAFGAERRAMLEWLWHGAPEYAWVAATPDGRLAGYVLGRHGHRFEQLGPIGADDPRIAAALASTCLAHHPTRMFIVDAPSAQTEWRAWLAAAGFVEQRPFVRMSRGRPAPAGQPAHLFATLGPEFG